MEIDSSTRRNLMWLLLFLAVMTGFIAGHFLGRKQSRVVVEQKTELVTDTLIIRQPAAKDEKVVKRDVNRSATSRPHNGAGGSWSDSDTTAKAEAGQGLDFVELADSSTWAGTDTMEVIQRHYTGEEYEAWVSGPIDPRLDSIHVYKDTERIITTVSNAEGISATAKKNKHWHIGVSAGYGYTPTGFAPYVGVGITYSIVSF